MASICKSCHKNINNFCKVSGEPISRTRNKCKKFKMNYQQESLFEAVGNSSDANNSRRSKKI